MTQKSARSQRTNQENHSHSTSVGRVTCTPKRHSNVEFQAYRDSLEFAIYRIPFLSSNKWSLYHVSAIMREWQL